MKGWPLSSPISWMVQMLGVVERGSGLCLPTKAFQGLRVGGERVGQEFQGDVAEELGVFGFVNVMPPPPSCSRIRKWATVRPMSGWESGMRGKFILPLSECQR